jgi:hypothetical protein
MVVDALFGVVNAVLTAVFAALPTIDVQSFLSPVLSVGTTAGRYVGIVNGILPASEIVTMLHGVYVVLLPALVVYKIANWVWRHIPDLWGFGPGAG